MRDSAVYAQMPFIVVTDMRCTRAWYTVRHNRVMQGCQPTAGPALQAPTMVERGEVLMTPPVVARRYTPEDLLAIPDGHRFDLVDGCLVERHRGAESSWIALQVNHHLCLYVATSQRGLVLGPDCGYQIF